MYSLAFLVASAFANPGDIWKETVQVDTPAPSSTGTEILRWKGPLDAGVEPGKAYHVEFHGMCLTDLSSSACRWKFVAPANPVATTEAIRSADAPTTAKWHFGAWGTLVATLASASAAGTPLDGSGELRTGPLTTGDIVVQVANECSTCAPVTVVAGTQLVVTEVLNIGQYASPRVVVQIGQSEDDGGPFNDLDWGRAPVHAGAQLYVGGVRKLTYPQKCGPWPYTETALLAAGVPDPIVIVRALASTDILYQINTNWPNARTDLSTLGLTADAVFVGQGEADALVQSKADAYEGNLGTLVDVIHVDEPDAAIWLLELLSTDPAQVPYHATVRAAEHAVADANPGLVYLIPTQDPQLAMGDGLHPTAGIGGGYDVEWSERAGDAIAASLGM